MLHHVLFLTHSNQHSQHPKNYKTEKLRNNMEGDKEKKSIDTQCESNINTCSEKLVSSENRAR